MRSMRMALTALLVVSSAGLVAGCGTGTDGGSGTATTAASPTPSKAPTPNEIYDKAVQNMAATSYKFSVTGALIAFTGGVDAPAKRTVGKIKISAGTVSATYDMFLTTDVQYLKLTGLSVGGIPTGKWYRVDPTKLTNAGALSFGDLADPTGLGLLGERVSTLDKVSDTQLKGTLDLTRGGTALATDADAKELGELAKTIPFDVTLNAEGRITAVKYVVPPHGKDKQDTITMTYTAFGAPVLFTPPSAGVVPAPPSVYTFFND